MRLSFYIKVRLQKSDNWFAQGESKCIKIFKQKIIKVMRISMIAQNIVATKTQN